MNARFRHKNLISQKMFCQQPFTALKAVWYIPFCLFVLFWRKGFYLLFHLVAEVARRKKRYFSVLSLTGRPSFSAPLNMFIRCGNVPRCDGFLLLGGSSLDHSKRVSQFQPEWICWEPGVAWVRSHRNTPLRIWHIFPFTVMPFLWRICSGIFVLVCR